MCSSAGLDCSQVTLHGPATYAHSTEQACLVWATEETCDVGGHDNTAAQTSTIEEKRPRATSAKESVKIALIILILL